MKIDFTKKQWTILISLIVTGLVILAGVNYFALQPAEKRLQYKKDELGIQVKLQEAVEAKVDSIDENETPDSNSLQKKIPVEPLTERVILDLEKAELLSGSTIQSLQFEKTDGALAPKKSEETEAAPAVDTQLPALLKRIQMTIVVESPSYFEMEAFLDEIENLERIVEINGLYFEGEQELKENMEGYSEDTITFEVIASAFYIPELNELKDGLPVIESPSPSLKKDPFPQFPDEGEND
jgi:type IV pilus assembly protein PilO